MHPTPEKSAYEVLGGEDTLRALVDDFYDFMESEEQFTQLRRMHPEDLQSSRDKLYMFLSGWLGGPQLYTEKHGHPMLRRRHMPFPIGSDESRQWIDCMVMALDNQKVEGQIRDYIENALRNTANHMINQPT